MVITLSIFSLKKAYHMQFINILVDIHVSRDWITEPINALYDINFHPVIVRTAYFKKFSK